ncbi:MAG: tryptophan synthase subunit alpha [Gammaproteobacteria bacterium]
MSRIGGCFERLQRQDRCALVPFVTAGDPDLSVTLPLMHSLVAAGGDIIELGVPFSDPMADGPVIQRANERALASGMSLRKVLALVESFRADDVETPIVLMGYLNPIEVMGYVAFSEAAAAVGVDGVITVDLPPEEASPLVQTVRDQGIDPIFLLAPTSDKARMTQICAMASGFVYYVSLKGVTGAAHLDIRSVAAKVAEIRQITALPVGVGFGIRDPESAANIAMISDAVVVGSALVQRIEALANRWEAIPTEVPTLLSEMRRAMDVAGGGRS